MPGAGTPGAGAPLAGIRVVDLSRHLPGPLVAHLLADLGARVLKVEEPRLGDPVRQAPPFVEGRGALAHLLLTGVESLALDLKRPAAREVLGRLLAEADVLLSTFRPGTLARLGLAPEELRERFPRLIIASLSGWGEDGPLARRAGHDLTYQATAGALAPTAAMPAAPTADLLGAWSTVATVLAALFARERNGRGATVDAALYDAAVHGNLTAWAAEAGAPRGVGERLGLSGALPCYDLYPTADGGLLAVAALELKFWRRFCELLARPHLGRRPYTSDPGVRAEVGQAVRERSREEWGRILAGEDLPVAIVLSAAEAAAHPQAEARGVLSWDDDILPRLAFPARIDGERPRAGDPFPELGEHTAAVLGELGLAAPSRLPAGRARSGIGPRPSLAGLLGRLLAVLRPRG